MQAVKCPFGPGLIAVTSGDLARYNEFELSMWTLLVPNGSTFGRLQGNDIAFGRNLGLRQHLKPEHEWVWFIDDDNPFPPDILMRLLSRRVDLIQPLVVNRKPPYVSHAQRYVDGKALIIPWNELTGDVMECDLLGAGGLLVQRDVLDAVGDPWFRIGQHHVEHLQEDMDFCIRAKAAGFRCWVDLEHPIGHCNTHTVWPVKVEGQWRIQLDLGHGAHALLPADNGHGIADEIPDSGVTEKH